MSFIELERPANERSECDEIFRISDSGIERPVQNVTSKDDKKSEKEGLFPLPKGSLFWSKGLYRILLIAFGIFVCISIIIGILTVYYGSQKETNKICELTFKRTIQSLTGYNSRPKQVVSGDLNNDTEIDLIVANSETDSIGIFLGYSNGTFTNQRTYFTGYKSRPYSIAIEDFNQDNKLDLIIAYYGYNSLGIHYGDGNGYFSNHRMISLGSSRPISLSIGNFNNDSYIDIAVINNGTSNLLILLGSFDGSFEIFTSYFMGYDSIPYSMDIADLNNDFYLDIVIVNYGIDNLMILLGNGDGRFINKFVYSTGKGSKPCSIIIADLNNDYYMDIAIANSGNDNIGIFYGFNNGTFTNQIIYSTGLNSKPNLMNKGDFNRDNKIDLIIINSEMNNLIIFEQNNNKTLTLITKHLLEYQSEISSIIINDFDHDNQSDVILTNFNYNNFLFLNQYKSNPIINLLKYPTESNAYSVRVDVIDLNDDNQLDMIVINRDTNTIGILMGERNEIFGNITFYTTGDFSQPWSFAIGDINNDNKLDLVVVLTNQSEILILIGNGNGTFEYGNRYSTGENSFPYSIILIDLNNDTNLDILIGNILTNNILIFIGNGNGIFINERNYSIESGSNYISFQIGDINYDQINDIIIANYQSQNLCILFGNSNGIFSNNKYISTNNDKPSDLIVKDLNQDNQLDIIYTSPLTYCIGILYGLNNNNFTNIIRYSIEINSNPQYVQVGDVNHDNQSDLIIVNYLQDNIEIFYGNLNGTFDKSIKYSTGTQSLPNSIVLGDFNHDQWIDMVITNEGTNNFALFIAFNYPTYRKEDISISGITPSPNYVVVADLNNDNFSDIVVLNQYGDTIDIYLGNRNGSFTNEITLLLETSSSSTCILLIDFNHDNNLDIIVSNYNIQTLGIFLGFGNGSFQSQIHWTSPQVFNPRSIVSADLNNDKNLDIIVANDGLNRLEIYFGDGNYSPINRRTLSTGVSSLPSYVLVDDLNQDTYLDLIVANPGTMNIGIFFGFGNGSFRQQIIYSTNNSITPRSLALGDLNRDNNIDIVIGGDTSSNIGIFFGSSNGTFSTMITYSIISQPFISSIFIIDLNNDNSLDIILTDWGISNNNLGNLAVLYGFGNGEFAVLKSYLIGFNTNPIFAAFADLNQDNQLDIVTANYFSDSINMVIANYGSDYVEILRQTCK
ncbi:hypothetical protein I4U23_013736 [Adineta vaga]|nr:hypothetical protein I4U23_013736 [Adineta vaga]